MGKLLKELLYISEGRDPSLQYTEKKVKDQVDRVIVQLSGHQSGRFTKLVKQYKEMQEELEKLTTVKDALNESLKEEMIPLFNAEDEIFTRVVETCGASLVLAKKAKPTEKTDWEGLAKMIMEEITDMMPEAKEKMEQLVKLYTTVKESDKAPGLRVDIKEGAIKSIIAVIKELSNKFISSISSWTKKYDRRLDKIRLQLEEL